MDGKNLQHDAYYIYIHIPGCPILYPDTTIVCKSINVNYKEWHTISSQIRLDDWIPQSITESCKAGEATRSLCIARLRLTQISELQKICLHSDWSSSPYKRGLNLDLPFSQDADLHSIEHLLSPSLPTVESRESSWWNKVESPRPLIFTLM